MYAPTNDSFNSNGLKATNESFNSNGIKDWSESEVENLSFTHSPYGCMVEKNMSFCSAPEVSPGRSTESLDETYRQGLKEQTMGGTPPPPKSCNVYVSNLPTGVDDAWLREEFGRYGLITSAKVMQAYSKKRVYAFVQFTEEHMATAAVKGANGVYVGNYALVVKHADRDKDKGLPNQPSNNLYISNLPTDYGLADLEALFAPYGQVSSSVVLTHPQTGAGKGVGLVRYFCVADATKAIAALHGKVLDGYDRPLEVKYAENQEAKQVRKMPQKHNEEAANYSGNFQGKQQSKGRAERAGKDQHGQGKASNRQTRPVTTNGQKNQQNGAHKQNKGDTRRQVNSNGNAAHYQNDVVDGHCPNTQPIASVYVGGLPRDMSNLHAYQIFAPYGALVTINLQPDPRADTSYAYIHFRSAADAANAVNKLNGSVLQRRRLYAALHTPAPGLAEKVL